MEKRKGRRRAGKNFRDGGCVDIWRIWRKSSAGVCAVFGWRQTCRKGSWRAACLTKSYLSEVERGKVNISVANLDKIAEALGVPLFVLLDCGDLPGRNEVLRDLAELPDDALAALHRLSRHIGRGTTPGNLSGM